MRPFDIPIAGMPGGAPPHPGTACPGSDGCVAGAFFPARHGRAAVWQAQQGAARFAAAALPGTPCGNVENPV